MKRTLKHLFVIAPYLLLAALVLSTGGLKFLGHWGITLTALLIILACFAYIGYFYWKQEKEKKRAAEKKSKKKSGRKK